MYSHWIFAACAMPRPAAGYVDLCQEWRYRSCQWFCVVKAKDGYENWVWSRWPKVCWELWVLCYPEKFVRIRCNLMRLGYRQWNVFRLAIFSVSVFIMIYGSSEHRTAAAAPVYAPSMMSLCTCSTGCYSNCATFPWSRYHNQHASEVWFRCRACGWMCLYKLLLRTFLCRISLQALLSQFLEHSAFCHCCCWRLRWLFIGIQTWWGLNRLLEAGFWSVLTLH